VGKRRNIEREVRQLRRHALPMLGDRPVNRITPPDILRVCWSRYEPDERQRSASGKLGEKSVRNLKGVLSSVFSLAVPTGRGERGAGRSRR
jgi:hypothetical protein